MTSQLNISDFQALTPLLAMISWALLVLIAATAGSSRSRALGPMTAYGFAIGIGLSIWSWCTVQGSTTYLLGATMVSDRFAFFFDALLCGVGLLTALSAGSYLDEHECCDDSFFATLLLSVTGAMTLVHAGAFITFIIGLETLSLAVYAMVGAWSERRIATEGALKYFIMGAVASAFLFYGFALLYGASGVMRFDRLAEHAAKSGAGPVYLLGMLMVLGALAFKVSLVPFHMWTPDAYEGAPTPVTGFMAGGVKIAGFGALLRLLCGAFSSDNLAFGPAGWTNALWVIAVLTMTVGNITAMRQQNIKRLLAYSSIAHAGFMVIGILSAKTGSVPPSSVLYYLLVYALTTVGVFAVISWLGRRDAERVDLDDWAGLAKIHPFMALLMTLFLLSLGGLPPTGGFFAKFYIFRSALEEPQLRLLVVIAALNSVLAMFYYLKPVVAMYFREGPSPADPAFSSPRASRSEAVDGTPVAVGSLNLHGLELTLGICALAILLLGIWPEPSLKWAMLSFITP